VKDPLTEDLAAIRRFRKQRLKELLREFDERGAKANRRTGANESRSRETRTKNPAMGGDRKA
jgi:hypothetical protein